MAEARWEEEEDGSYRYYYSDGTMATGWMSDGSDWYYLYGDGIMATGWINWKGDWYFLYPEGSMAHERSLLDSTYNNGFDIDSTGKMVNGTGWLHDGITGDWYYYSDGSMICNDTVGEYRLDSNGKMVTGTGWVKYDEDNWCYLYDNGSMAWGRTVEGYYLNDKGEWVHGEDGGWQHEDKDGIWYYVWSNGTVATGWQKLDSKWYYFDDDGKMQTGWIEDNGKWYYLNSDGVWEPSEDNSNTSENSDSSNSQGTSNTDDDYTAIVGAKLCWDGSAYFYVAGDKTINVSEDVLGLVPYVGVSTIIGDKINNLINSKDIDLNASTIDAALSNSSTAGTYLGFFQAGIDAIKDESKLLGTVSKISNKLGLIGTAAGVVKTYKDYTDDKSYDVSKAVELSRCVGWDTKEKAVALAVFAQNIMGEMLDNKQVSLNKDKTEIIWNDKIAEKAYYDAIWAIKCK